MRAARFLKEIAFSTGSLREGLTNLWVHLNISDIPNSTNPYQIHFGRLGLIEVERPRRIRTECSLRRSTVFSGILKSHSLGEKQCTERAIFEFLPDTAMRDCPSFGPLAHIAVCSTHTCGERLRPNEGIVLFASERTAYLTGLGRSWS